MPYILLVIGLLIGGFGLYRFLLKADMRQIKALFLVAALFTMIIALFFLTITQRFGAALGILAALFPFALSLYRTKTSQSASPSSAETMNRAEALDILGVPENASEDEIISAHKRLMKKLHPDQDGSEGLAKKINSAKDILLKK